MVVYEESTVNVLDLTGNIQIIDDRHTVTNKRRKFIICLLILWLFCLLTHLVFLFFVKKIEAYQPKYIQPQKIILEINLKIHTRTFWIILPRWNKFITIVTFDLWLRVVPEFPTKILQHILTYIIRLLSWIWIFCGNW